MLHVCSFLRVGHDAFGVAGHSEPSAAGCGRRDHSRGDQHQWFPGSALGCPSPGQEVNPAAISCFVHMLCMLLIQRLAKSAAWLQRMAPPLQETGWNDSVQEQCPQVTFRKGISIFARMVYALQQNTFGWYSLLCL